MKFDSVNGITIVCFCFMLVFVSIICGIIFLRYDFEAGNVGVLEGVEFSNGMCHVTLSGEVFHVAGLGKSSVEVDGLLGHVVKLRIGSGGVFDASTPGYLDLFEEII